jgi:LuxR family maltose regulon positive regulatory protein
MSLGRQVFLSYATEDADSARLLCRVLEAEEGIRCWIAPRDVEAGTDYAAAILHAIKDSELVLLLFSSFANSSPYVLREIERAIAYERPVVSLRLDDTTPSASLEYYLNLWQWLETPRGVESKRREIVAAVRKRLDGAGDPCPAVNQAKTRPESRLDSEILADEFRPLRSKLRPASSHLPLVHRGALVDALARSRAPLILVSAPAGAGKSTLLGQLAGADARPVAWVQLDEGDNDPIVLMTYLALALDAVSPVDKEMFPLLRVRVPPVDERILPGLAEALATAPAFRFVLDDAHLITSAECWRILSFIADHLPDGCHMLIGTRTDPPLPLARLHAAGRLTEYRMMDLAMTRDEAGGLLELYGQPADGAVLDGLMLRTEGWITGLCLALLAGDGRSPTDLLANTRGGRREIAGYLTGEVLDRQPERIQRFLLQTSVLDALTADLCRAVTGYDDAGAVLTRLADENVFVTALDDQDEWYRYHHLFAELLELQFERRRPCEPEAAHRAAALWYSDHDMVGQAVRHWLAAGEVQRAAEPAALECWELVDKGQVQSARLLLERFTDAQILAHVPLTLAAGYLYGTVLDDARLGERWRRAACVAPADDRPMANGAGTWREMQLGLRAFLAPDGVRGMLADAELALTLSAEFPLDVQAECKRTLGVATYLNGDSSRAVRLFADTAADAGAEATEAYALAFLSLIAGDEGRWDDAAQLDATALQRSPTMTLDISPGMYLALPMLLARTRLLAHLAHADCSDWRARTESYLRAMVPQVPWRIMLVAVVLGETALKCGDLAEATRWLSRAEGTLRGTPDAGILARRIKHLRLAIEGRSLADPLTASERRVLELLPTQLTTPQMAERLFVSANTVKSHQRHLYATLGVTTRTAVVERARELGLL